MIEMLKHKFSAIILIMFIMLLSGCATEYNIATKKEEWVYYSTDKEIQMGESIAKEIEKKYKFVDDPLIVKRVEDIGKRIVAVCDRKDISYHFYVLNEEDANAASLPGGFVYINNGLIDKISNDDELACVIAHEIGHIVARHSVKKLQALMGYTLLRILLAQAPASGEIGTSADIAFSQILLGYSREDELLADQLAARYARLAGFNPNAMVTFLEKLRQSEKYKLKPLAYAKTHPYIPDRIRVVKQELGQDISFEDYINIEQQPHK
jgi:predicted Zn-dependent protease